MTRPWYAVMLAIYVLIILASAASANVADNGNIVEDLGLYSLFDETVSDMTLSVLIPKLSKSMTSTSVQKFANQITEKDAAILTGRLLRSVSLSTEEVIQLLNLLLNTVNRSIFSSILLHDNPSLDRIQSLPLPDQVYHIPEPILKIITEISTSAQPDHISSFVDRVQHRYPSPFNSIFPNNDRIARELLDHPDLGELLTDRGVVLALIVYGIQFDLVQFLEKVQVSAERLLDLVPLLRQDPNIPPSIIIDKVIIRRRYDLAAALIRCPSFSSHISEDATAIIDVFVKSIRERKLHLLETAVTQPFAEEIINVVGRYSGETLLGCALSERNMEAAAVLVQVPNIALCPSGEGESPSYSPEFLQLLERHRPELVAEVRLCIPEQPDSIPTETRSKQPSLWRRSKIRSSFRGLIRRLNRNRVRSSKRPVDTVV